MNLYPSGFLADDVSSIYQSLLNGIEGGQHSVLQSCPVQTQAEPTSKTGSLRQDGVSSLPQTYRLDFNVGFNEPFETTVLDSSSPMDGISLPNLLYSVVELTPASLPTECKASYSNCLGVVVEIDEQSLQVGVETLSDSVRINITNLRHLKLCSPMPGDSVRVVRGDNAGSVGSVISQQDESHVVVKFNESTCRSLVLPSSDVVRLDSSTLQNSSTTSSPPNLGVEDYNISCQGNKHSPSFSTGWRSNSPAPSSPMDSLISNSPSSSLVGGITSPGNPWSVSSEMSSVAPDVAHCFSSVSSASSANISAASMNKQHHQVQSLPVPPTNEGLVRTETYLQNAYDFNSLPTITHGSNNASGTTTAVEQLSSPNSCCTVQQVPSYDPPVTKPTSSPSTTNLYPVIQGDEIFSPSPQTNNGFSVNQPSGMNGFHSTGMATYPVLPSYGSLQLQQHPCIAMLNPSQQIQCTPFLLSNGVNYGGYTMQQTQQYQPSMGVVGENRVRPHTYDSSYGQTRSGSLYPQLNSMTATNTRNQQYQMAANRTYCGITAKNILPFSSRRKPCSPATGLYPSLPGTGFGKSSNVAAKQSQSSPWDEFRVLVSSTQNSLTSSQQKLSLEIVIDTAIKELSKKIPPQQWYNPLSIKAEDNNCENDLSTESVHVSALCPLIKQRMDYPCRGLSCTHLQCFDAKAFLKLALKRRSQLVSSLKGSGVSNACHTDNGWKCPMCGKIVSVNQLYIENTLQRAISTCDAVELEFKGAGIWVPYEKPQETKCTSVIDLTMDSDDD